MEQVPAYVKANCAGPMLEHWLELYGKLREDIEYLRHVRVMQLEQLLAVSKNETQEVINDMFNFLHLKPVVTAKIEDSEAVTGYYQRLSELRQRAPQRFTKDGAFMGNIVALNSRIGLPPAGATPPQTQPMDTSRAGFLSWPEQKGATAEQQDPAGSEPVDASREPRQLSARAPGGPSRQLLNYWGDQDDREVVIHSGGAFDWIATVRRTLQLDSPQCQRVFKHYEPHVQRYGYSLYNLTFFEMPEAFASHMLRKR